MLSQTWAYQNSYQASTKFNGHKSLTTARKKSPLKYVNKTAFIWVIDILHTNNDS